MFNKYFQPIREFANKGWWQKLLIGAVVLVGVGVANHFLGDGNIISQQIETLDDPLVSSTTP